MTCHQTYMTHHSFPGYPGIHEPLADRRRAAGLARPGADDRAAERADEPAAAPGVRRFPGGLRGPGGADRRARRPVPGVRDREHAGLGAEPGVASAGPDAAPRPG